MYNILIDRTGLVYVVLTFVIFQSAGAQPIVRPENQGLSTERLERISPVMQGFVDQGLVPGMSVTVARHGQVVFSERYGYMDIESQTPLSEDAIYRIYSMSKAITGVAVMMLLEEGRFLLDDPISKYIPAFKDMKVFVRETPQGIDLEAARREITVRDLLSHASGLGYGWGNDPVSRLYQNIQPMDPSLTLEQAVTKLASLPLYFQPGTDWRYSTSIDVIGRLIEVTSDKTLETFFQERIFEPLGMRDTGFFLVPEHTSRLTTLYTYNESGELVPDRSISRYQRHENRLLSGGGGLLSTEADYLRFVLMLANGGVYNNVRLLSPKTIQLMSLDHLAEGIELPWFKLKGHGYGLSVSVLRDLSKSPSMGSLGDFGWDGAASTFFRVDLKTGIAILLMTHRMPTDDAIQLKLKNLVYQALVDSSLPEGE